MLRLLFFLLCWGLVAAENATENTMEHSVVPIPVVYYTPETEFAGGATVVYRYGRLGERASSLMPVLVYTQRKQRIVNFKWNQYYNGGEYHSFVEYRGSLFPDKFFGVSNATRLEDEEEYTLRNHRAIGHGERRVTDSIYAGLAVFHHQYRITDRESGGLLETLNPLGVDDARLNGLGPRVFYDSRDNAFSARMGSFHELTIVRYLDEFGSTADFTFVDAALRKYVSLTAADVVTAEVRFAGLKGDVPLAELAKLGGSKRLRGYFRGRYQDKNSLSLQTEYRRHVWKPLWLAGFFGVGAVAPTAQELADEKYHPSGGGGIRWVLDPKARTTIRLDFGVGRDQKGIYFGINEAY